jgi:carboxylesterase type B
MGVNRDEEGVLAQLYNTIDLDTGIEDISRASGLNASTIIASNAFPLGSNANQTIAVFNTTTRIATDASFHCSNQFVAYAGVSTGALPTVYYYEMNRTYQDPGYDSNHVCQAPVTPSHPFGDPEMEYFKCHAGDLAVTFGNWARVGFPTRDEFDKPFTQLVVDYWTTFARSGNPNPSVGYLKARGYWATLAQIDRSGPWEKVEKDRPRMMELQWDHYMRDWTDQKQCAVLGQPTDYLLQ